MSLLFFENVSSFYSHLIKGLEDSQNSIQMSYLAFTNGKYTNEISEILTKKAATLKKVDLTIDRVGNFFEEIKEVPSNFLLYKRLKESQVNFNFYEELNPIHHLHAKMCIIDNKKMYFGGSNISDHYTDWMDTNFLLTTKEAKLFENMYEIFTNLHSTSSISKYTVDKSTTLYAHIPRKHDHLEKEFIKLIKNAKKYLRIVTWYFLPNESIINTLKKASKRGVDIKIIYSEKNRFPITNIANIPTINELSKEKNIRIIKWKNGYNHSKLYWSESTAMIGSANLDLASLKANSELLVLRTEKKSIDRLNTIFEKLIIHSN